MKRNILPLLAITAGALLTACVSDGDDYAYDSKYDTGATAGGSSTASGAQSGTREASAPRAGFATTKAPAGMVAKAHAIPTGDHSTSAILLEKITPKEVAVGQAFDYQLRITNLATYNLENVVVTDNVSSDFMVQGSSPKATKSAPGAITWSLGDLAPAQTAVIDVTGAAAKAVTLTSCATVDYDSAVCAAIAVVAPALAVDLSTVSEVLVCDEIPLEYKVTNTGTGTARDVVVTSALPNGLVAKDGRKTVTLRVPSLESGKSKTIVVEAVADAAGKYTAQADASMTGGIKAQPVSRTINVREPKLALTASAPKKFFIGRAGTWSYTLMNSGDVASSKSLLELTVPSSLEYVDSSAKVTKSGSKLVFDLGTIPAGGTTKVDVRMRAEAKGNARVAGLAKGYCAKAASASTDTALDGIPAILLEVVDLEDPVLLGDPVTYEIRVTNQGSAPGTAIKIACTLDKGMSFVSGDGPTKVTANGAQITCAPLASLAPGKSVKWRLNVKGATSGDLRFTTAMTSDQLTRSVDETESTNFYE